MRCDYTYEDGDRRIRLECSVEATVIPPTPGSFSEPDDDGGLDGVQFTINQFFLTVSGKEFDLTSSLTNELKESLAEMVSDNYEKNGDLQSMLFAYMYEAQW